MKCRLKKIVTTASAVALTFAATPTMKLYAASVKDTANVISEASENTTSKAAEKQTWAEPKKLVEDIVIEGDLCIRSDINMNGHTLTVKGDLYHTSGTISTTSGSLIVEGSYLMEEPDINDESGTGYAVCTAALKTSSSGKDSVYICGDLIIHRPLSSAGLSFVSGTLDVAGNINAEGGIKLNANYNATLVLSGESTQYVNVGDSPILNRLVAENALDREIVWTGDLYVNKLYSDIVIRPDHLNIKKVDLNKCCMTVNGLCGITNCEGVNLNSGYLTINGDLLHKEGTVNCNLGTLIVNGSYIMENVSDDSSSVDGYDVCYANVQMTNESDAIYIYGDIITHKIADNCGFNVTKGIVNVSGNIDADNGINLNLNYNATLYLNGDSTQYVRFGDSPILNRLVAERPLEREIVWTGDLYVNKLYSDIIIRSDHINLKKVDLNKCCMTVNGLCGITNCEGVNLNGGYLTINGDLLHKEGVINCNKGKIIVNGSYIMENVSDDSSSVDGYDVCYATLQMTDESEAIYVYGDIITHKIADKCGFNVTKGAVNVSGNIDADNGINLNLNYNATLYLNGDSTQYVRFGDCPILNRLVAERPLEREIVWTGDLYVNKLYSDIVIRPDHINLKKVDLNKCCMTVNGLCSITNCEGVNLNGGYFTINGDLLHKEGVIKCNKGMIIVNGSYIMENVSDDSSSVDGYDVCYAAVQMTNESDAIYVYGDIITHKLADNCGFNVTKGAVNVSGNIDADNGINLNLNYNATLYLNGDSTQYVRFGDCPILNRLVAERPLEREIVWTGDLYVNKLYSDIIIRPDNINLKKVDLNKCCMTVNGLCGITNCEGVNLNGGYFTINGDLLHKEGVINCNKGKIIVNGSYIMENVSDDSSSVDGYDVCYATLQMTDESDAVYVYGDIITHKIVDNGGFNVTNGAVNVSGNIDADNGINMNISNEATLYLNGDSTQYVRFGDSPILNRLVAERPLEREIVWTGDLYINKLYSDIIIRPDHLNLKKLDLNKCCMTINGSCGMAEYDNSDYTVNLDGGFLTINGDFLHRYRTVICNEGTLIVNGNYIMENVSDDPACEDGYDVCSAKLSSSNDNDKVYIYGDIITHKIASSCGFKLVKGYLTVTGNIDSEDGLNISSSYKHTTFLDGEGKQFIKLGEKSKFNILVIRQPMSNYSFEPKECWKKLIDESDSHAVENPTVSYEKGTGSVKLTWKAVPGAEKYGIAMYANGKWRMLGQGSGTSYVVNDLKAGVDYRVAVVTKINGEWNLDYSKAITVTPKAGNRYPVVTSEVSGRQFRLNWTAADGAEKYGIAVYQSGKWQVKVQLKGDVTSYTSPKMNRGEYQMIVCAKVNGAWDTGDIKNRTFTVTIK